MLVVGGWINWKYNQLSPIWWLVAELTGNNYCHTRTQLKILAHLIIISDDKLGPARALNHPGTTWPTWPATYFCNT